MNYDFVKITYQPNYNTNYNHNNIWYGYLGEKIYDCLDEFVLLKINNKICEPKNIAIDTGYTIHIDVFDSNLDGIQIVEEQRKIIIFS